MRLVLLPEAELDLLDGQLHYEEERAGLGLRFERAVEGALERILAGPLLYSLVPGVPERLNVRRALVGRFPYAVIYAVRGPTIYVVAVAHGRRRPGFWLSRLDRQD